MVILNIYETKLGNFNKMDLCTTGMATNIILTTSTNILSTSDHVPLASFNQINYAPMNLR